MSGLVCQVHGGFSMAEKCIVCGNDNTEFAEFKIKVVVWIIPVDVTIKICQKCISKTFSNFRKEK